MGLTANEVKQIKALRMKKARIEQGLYLVEGPKLVEEAYNSNARIKSIYGIAGFLPSRIRFTEITSKQLSQTSLLSTPNGGFALVEFDRNKELTFNGKLTLGLDRINDPGNLGTILRIADWFGIEEVVCSPGSVDHTSHKVVQSSMGAVFRVKVIYQPLNESILAFKTATQGDVVTAEMSGENVYDYAPIKPVFLIMGSESHGVEEQVSKLGDKQIHIPGYGNAESLNVGVSTGIICSALMR